MKFLAIVLTTLLSLSSLAYAKDLKECEAKALSKDGKPLYGAAKDAFIKMCEADAKK